MPSRPTNYMDAAGMWAAMSDYARVRSLIRWHGREAREYRRLEVAGRAPWKVREHRRLAVQHEGAAVLLRRVLFVLETRRQISVAPAGPVPYTDSPPPVE